MADAVDEATDLAELYLRAALSTLSRHPIPAGTPGDCRVCGEAMPRLVNGRCAPCRDGRR